MALEVVDGVIVFGEDTPADAIRRVRPDLWVKGGDYAAADLPEAKVLSEWGGRAVTVPFFPGRSTTQPRCRDREASPDPRAQPSTTTAEDGRTRWFRQTKKPAQREGAVDDVHDPGGVVAGREQQRDADDVDGDPDRARTRPSPSPSRRSRAASP